MLTRPAFKETNMSEDFYTQFYDPYVYGSKAIRKPPPQRECAWHVAASPLVLPSNAVPSLLTVHSFPWLVSCFPPLALFACFGC